MQPDAWSCLPTCAAIVLGLEPREVIEEIGHDGSEIVFSDGGRRGFHVQEIVDVLIERGECPVLIETVPFAVHGGETYDVPVSPTRILSYLENYPGILLIEKSNGRQHACVWDMESVLDPVEGKYDLNRVPCLCGFIALV